MKKLSVLLLATGFLYMAAGNVFAQGRYISVGQAIRSGVMFNAQRTSRIAAREFFANRIPLAVSQFKTPEVIRTSLIAHGVQESLRTSEQYRVNLEKFLEIKKEMDIFLRYQLLEPQQVSAAELNSLWAEANEAFFCLQRMERIVGASDPGVHLGKLYIQRVMAALKPNYMGGSFKKGNLLPQKFRSTETFNVNNFLLKDPNGVSLTMKNTMPGSEGFIKAKEMAAQLPAMKVAVLNDDPEILEWARAWGAQGFFGKGSRVAVFDSLTKLMERTKDVKYDVILMDYVLDDGLSVFMMDRIRMAGDKSTVILVNSALMDDEVPAEELFEHGADGFISSVGFRADNGGARVANALYNYMQQHGREALTPHKK